MISARRRWSLYSSDDAKFVCGPIVCTSLHRAVDDVPYFRPSFFPFAVLSKDTGPLSLVLCELSYAFPFIVDRLFYQNSAQTIPSHPVHPPGRHHPRSGTFVCRWTISVYPSDFMPLGLEVWRAATAAYPSIVCTVVSSLVLLIHKQLRS